MQKGFATLEIILLTLIIAVLATVTIPNAARVIDRVTLDYETKRLYTDLRFLQSLDRMLNMRAAHLSSNLSATQISLDIYPEYYQFRRVYPKKIFDVHTFSNDVTANENGYGIWQIQFDHMGKISPAITTHLILKSRQGKEFYMYIDTVGRFSTSREDRYE